MILGNASPFAEGSSHSPNYLLGSPIVVSAESTIDAFGVSARKAARVVMALYTDEPMSLVASIEPSDVSASDQTIRPMIHPTIVPGTYWLLAVFDRHASVGIDRSDKITPVRYIAHDFDRALPEHIEVFRSYAGQRFNFWVVTE